MREFENFSDDELVVLDNALTSFIRDSKFIDKDRAETAKFTDGEINEISSPMAV